MKSGFILEHNHRLGNEGQKYIVFTEYYLWVMFHVYHSLACVASVNRFLTTGVPATYTIQMEDRSLNLKSPESQSLIQVLHKCEEAVPATIFVTLCGLINLLMDVYSLKQYHFCFRFV